MHNPLVSILIPTYNRAHLIIETLDSVLAQTYTNWECIVVDDGSTDNTEAVVMDYVKKDTRFQYHHRPTSKPKGANACRNYGFEISNGDYVKWLDSDDMLSKDLIYFQIEKISSNVDKKNIVVTSKWNFFKDSIIDIKPKEKQINKNYNSGIELILDFGFWNTFLPPHVYLISKEIVFLSGGWNESLLINQDGEFFVRVLLNANKIIHSEKGMVYYRFGFSNDNTSSFSSIEKCRHSILSWILIDSYIKIHINQCNSIRYVENAKKILLNNIFYEDLLKEYQWFLGKKDSFKEVHFFFSKTFKFLKNVVKKIVK
ncbi:MAG: glycosyltransferase family 2 protein [Flavobacterium sp.]